MDQQSIDILNKTIVICDEIKQKSILAEIEKESYKKDQQHIFRFEEILAKDSAKFSKYIENVFDISLGMIYI